MHEEILTQPQVELLPFIKKFRKNFCLVGGTAIAMQIGHRHSIDFDLFTKTESLDLKEIKNTIQKSKFRDQQILYEAFDQFHVLINNVKVTFFTFPYQIKANIDFEESCSMPDLLQLAAMKVFALGGRAKWKDYVDLFFILKSHFNLDEICLKTEEIFGDLFSRKLLLQQLSYFNDIDYSEEVEFIGSAITKEEVKKFLVNISTQDL